MAITDDELAAARAAVDSVGIDTAALAAALIEAYGESYVVGTHVAMETLPAEITATGPGWVTAIDWADWEPGHATAAAELAGTDGGRGLARMLDEAAIVIRGIDDTTRDLLAHALAEGTAAGENAATLAGRLSTILDDPARAEMVARTESARAMTVAARDSYTDNGIAGRQWLAASDAEPDCAALNGAIVAMDAEFPTGDPPLHPRCRCAIAPVLAAEMEMA